MFIVQGRGDALFALIVEIVEELTRLTLQKGSQRSRRILSLLEDLLLREGLDQLNELSKLRQGKTFAVNLETTGLLGDQRDQAILRPVEHLLQHRHEHRLILWLVFGQRLSAQLQEILQGQQRLFQRLTKPTEQTKPRGERTGVRLNRRGKRVTRLVQRFTTKKREEMGGREGG